MEHHLNYITLGVADLAASRRFYRETFGWQERDDSNDNIAWQRVDTGAVSAQGGGCNFRRISRTGRSYHQTAASRILGGYSGYISDPDGFLGEIAHNPYLEKLR